MKKTEAIRMYEDAIKKGILTAVKDTAGNPSVKEHVYVWEDGEIEFLFGVTGDNSWLQPKDSEDRQLFYIDTIIGVDLEESAFCEGRPDDEDEAQMLLDAAIDEYIEEFDVDEILDMAYEKAEAEERYADEEDC